MSTFDNLPPSKPSPRRPKNNEVFSVGWRAFVHWPQLSGRSPVPLCDTDGRPLSNDLADGEEVEILSWRPNAREGSLYNVRRMSDRSEWWISAIYLRKQQAAPPPPPDAVAQPR